MFSSISLGMFWECYQGTSSGECNITIMEYIRFTGSILRMLWECYRGMLHGEQFSCIVLRTLWQRYQRTLSGEPHVTIGNVLAMLSGNVTWET